MEAEGQPWNVQGVALLLPSLEIGGTERVGVTLANEFVRQGVRTRLICGRAEGPLSRDVSPEVSVIDLNATRFRYSLVPLVRHLRDDPPSAMLTMLTQSNLVGLVATHVTRSRPRLVVSERSSIYGTRRTPEATWQRLASPILGRAYRAADAVVVPSAALAQELIQIGVPDSMVHVIPNPVDIQHIRRSAQARVDHPWFHEDVPIVCAVGRLTPSKDLPTLVRGFAILRRHVRARLVIIGEGPERNDIEKSIQDEGLTRDVTLLGSRSNPYPYIAHSSVLASSSVVEGFPNVLVEALALGIPVVAADCPTGPAEILQGGEYGELVRPGDSAHLAGAIARAIRPSIDGARLRRRAEAWSSPLIASAYLGVIAPHATSRDGADG